MMTFLYRSIAVGLLVLTSLPSPAAAQLDTDDHVVRVEVLPMHALAISKPSLNLEVTPQDVARSGSPTTTVVDATTELLWLTNSRGKKITVSTDLPSPRFPITVEALDATAGATMGAVPLEVTPRDFITDVGRSAGSRLYSRREAIRIYAALRHDAGPGAARIRRAPRCD